MTSYIPSKGVHTGLKDEADGELRLKIHKIWKFLEWWHHFHIYLQAFGLEETDKCNKRHDHSVQWWLKRRETKHLHFVGTTFVNSSLLWTACGTKMTWRLLTLLLTEPDLNLNWGVPTGDGRFSESQNISINSLLCSVSCRTLRSNYTHTHTRQHMVCYAVHQYFWDQHMVM
jgi:hypothetical protein